MKDYTDIVNRAKKRKKEEEENNSSSSRSFYDATSIVEKAQLGKTINFDTFESDLQSMGATIGDIYSGWQTQETMNNTRSSIESMQNRINAYQTYQSKYGGNDLSEVASGYQSVLNDWDNLASAYGYYQNADAFNTAKKKLQLDEQFGGLSYDEVQAKKGEYAPDSDEYKYLNEYLGYTDLRDFDKALKDVEANLGSEDDASYQKQLQEARNRHELDNKFDLYKDYMGAEDFEELSQYNSTKSDKWHAKLTSQYGMGYEDITYEYINNVDGIRDEIKQKASSFGSDTGNTTSTMEKKGYDKLNEDEIAVYNYIYEKEGKEKAQEFLDAMEITLTKRVYDETTQRWEDATDSGAVASTIMSAMSVPANIMGGFTGAVDALGDAIQGKEYNPYSYYKTPSNFSADTRQYVGDNIAEETAGMELFGKNVPSFLYQTGMSTADSAVGALSLGSAFAPIMGSTAFQQKAKELTEAGASEEEVVRGALASGTFEMLFEKMSLDNLFKIKNADSFGKVVKETFKQAGIEGSEEMFTEISNVIFDTINRGETSDVRQSYKDYLDRGFSEEEAERKVKQDINAQIGWAGVGGALSGMAMGGTYSGAQYGDLKATGEQIRSNDRVQDMMDLSGLTPKESETYKLYTEYANKGITADNINSAKIGNLYATAQADAYGTIQSKKTTAEQKSKAMDTIKGLRAVDTIKDSKITSTGKSVNIEGIKKVDGDTVLVTNEGDVATNDMTLSYHDAELLSYVENMSEEKANLFLAQYDGKSDLEAYADSFNMAYTYGEVGMGADSVLKNKGVLTEAQVSEIYKTAITNKVTTQQKAIDDINAKYGKTVTVAGNFNDSIIDYDGTVTDGSKVNWKSLTKTQREAITFAKGFSQATGVNITFIKSDVVNGKRVGKNGSYNPATNTIEIDVYAGIIDATSVKDSIIPTLSHEMTHWMKAKSPAMYSKMQEHVLNTLLLDGKLTSEERISAEMQRIKENHPDMDVTEEMAIDEIVARACEDMLSNSNTARKILNQMSKKEQNSFVAKVKETFNNLMEWVNELLAKYKSNSKEAEILREYKARLKQLSKMWDKALTEAIQTNQSLQAEGITGEEVINAVTEKVGIAVDAKTESAYPSEQLSERTWTESEYVQEREKAVDQLSKNLDISKKKAGQYIDDVNSIARMIADDRARLDYEPSEGRSAFVSNVEYGGSIDFSTLCKKRRLYTGTISAIQEALPNTALLPEEYLAIRNMLLDKGYEATCGLCYVEGSRTMMGQYTKQFIEKYAKTNPPYVPTMAEMNTPDGQERIRFEHPEVYEKYVYFMNHYGRIDENDKAIFASQQKPKMYTMRTDYKHEIASKFKKADKVRDKNLNGGIRLQSFSDFEIVHLIDCMQVIMDMSKVGLAGQAYTKVPEFADALGNTGLKINLSLIAKGVDSEGNLVFDDVEGMPHARAMQLRDKYSSNVGTVLVVFNRQQLESALKNPNIDYVLPFHRSQWKKAQYDLIGLPQDTEDFTNYQNEKGAKSNIMPNSYWDFNKSGRANAEKYLSMCNMDGRTPKFPFLLEKNADGTYSLPEGEIGDNYFKLLIDFKMYDNSGKGSPQLPVKPNFSMEESRQMLEDYRGGHSNFPVANDVVDEFVAEYKKNHPQEQYSDREVRTLTNEDYEQVKSHFGTTTNYNVAGYMLKDGTMLDFSGKHWGDTYSRSRQVDHRDIQEVITDDNNGFDSMVNMISNGNIRLMPENGGINLAVRPTVEQSKMLEKYINNFRGEVVVDIDRVGGDTIKSFTYDRGTSAKKILDDIDNYFRGGRQSELMMFHTMYSDRVTDKATLDFLNDQIEDGEYATVYRSFQIIDGGLYAPMNAVDRDEDGKNKRLGYRSELGQWEMATESPEIAQRYMDNNPNAPYAKFDLDGVDNKTNAVAYNPYLHASNLVLNDQFSGAYRRKLVTVECRVPLSEAGGAYHAKYAKDATGWAEWKAGTVAGKLTKVKPELTRRLFLSRYMLPVRIVPDSEVAQMYKEYLDGTDISVPWNVITPSLREELEKIGVNVSYNDVKFGSKVVTFNDVFGTQYSDRDYMDAVNRGDMKKAQKMVDEKALSLGARTFPNGKLINYYHGSPSTFTSFNIEKAREGVHGFGFYFSPMKAKADGYKGESGRLISAYIFTDRLAKMEDHNLNASDVEKVLNDFNVPIDEQEWLWHGYDSLADWLKEESDRVAIQEIEKRIYRNSDASVGEILNAFRNTLGYDGIQAGNETILFDNQLMKLADPVTYDDSGNVIPLSKRFDTDNSDIRFSDRDNVSVYDAMGETDRLIAENQRLSEDIATLKRSISTNEVNLRRFRSLADYLKKLAGSQYNREMLGDELKELYSFIQTTENLQWNDVVAKAYDIANSMMNLNPNVSINYFREVMSNIRKDKVSLSEAQRAEAEKLFGSYGDFHKAMFGRVNVVSNGTPLDQMWKQWAKKYPAVFKADISATEQVEALVEVVNALKASSSMMGEYEREEAIRHLATEIYNQMWNIASDASEDVRKAKASHRKMMEDLRKEYEQRQKEKTLHPVGETALKYEKILRRVAEKDKAEIKRAKELGKKRLDEYKERAERNAKIESITKKALTLNQWLTKNSKDAHIPEVMKAPVAYLLNAIDFSSKQLLGMRGGQYAGNPTKKDISFSKALEQVHDMVQKINSAQIGEDEITEIYGTFADFPAGFADDIRELSSNVNDIMRTVGDNAYILNQMSLEQLETLDKIITTIKATVTKMNKFLAIRHAEGVANLSQQSINYMDSLGKAKERGKVGSTIEKMLDWGNALPYYTFKRFGEGGQKVYEALQDGWDKFAFHVNDIINYAESTYTDKEVKEWEAMVKEFSILEPATDEEKASPNYAPSYQKIKMTVPQIMSLYCLQKREQAKGHLMGGGMRVADFKVGKVNVKTVSQTEGVVLTESEIDTIISSLTDRQKAVADALQSFMNTTCTDWGNEVSMLRFGFKAFGEENYFPIQSDKNNLAVNDETEQNNSLFRLLNMSFTKGTINKANNRIVISDIFDVFAQHSSDMAKYNALALPVIDAFKWYNYKEKIKKGDTQFNTKSLKQSLENAFGKEAQNYIVTFLRDINGEQSAGRDVVGKGFFTNAKIASVGFNMRVVALQPTSYVRASAVIDQKYLTKAFLHKPKMHMAQKHCGIALWKSLGFYDINVQNSITDLIKHNQTARDKVVEASMKGAEIADKLTWGYLWNACELEVRDKQKNLRVGSTEFYSAVANRLREVIYTTQVVDSTMTRSHMMRSKDGWDKMATAFMSEPTLAYNMLQDCYMDWKLTERRTDSKQEAFKKCGKKMARVFTAYTVTNLLSALVESGFDIFRDDEDEVTPEEFIELYLKNFASNMNILNNIPYAKEVVSMMQGFSSSRTDTQWMQYLTYTITGIGKLVDGKGNAYTTAKNALRAFSYATGLPFYNVWRDSTALLDETELLTAEELEEMFNDTIAEIFPSLKSE